MKKKVLLIPSNREDGTSFYRANGPYSRIDDIQVVELTSTKWCDLINIDIAVLQRPADQYFVKLIEEIKLFNIPVVVDYDDDAFSINETNPAFEFYKEDDKLAAIRECIRLADVVTVSTQGLKNSLLEQVPEANIQVIVNAVDDYMFSLEPSYHERNKIIFMRGGSTHSEDWGTYKEAIIQIMKDHPDYSLAVMGYTPKWLTQISENQLRVYQFSDIATYFDTLMQLKPQIMIVPLTDSKFNHAKSNVSWIEGTVAGATIVASDLPEFAKSGCVTFSSNDYLYSMVSDLIESPNSRQLLYEMSMRSVPRLSEVNELRKDIIENLSRKKYSPYTKDPKQATEKEFHDYELSHGYTQDNKEYLDLNIKTVEGLISTVNPKTAFEFGSGTGGTLAQFLKKGIHAYGMEINPHSVEYFKGRYPMFENQLFLGDITKDPFEPSEVCDLGYSIEVFEHIDMPEDWWNQFISDLSTKFRWFYFSSTPFWDNEYFMKFWGHCNVRRTSKWIELFEKNGWNLHNSPKITTSWDLLFKSKQNH